MEDFVNKIRNQEFEINKELCEFVNKDKESKDKLIKAMFTFSLNQVFDIELTPYFSSNIQVTVIRTDPDSKPLLAITNFNRVLETLSKSIFNN